MGFVYIFESQMNLTYYVGSTTNLKRRLSEHFQGKSRYTKRLLPLKLVFFQKFTSISQARRAEYWLKAQKDRSFLARIIKEGKINKTF